MKQQIMRGLIIFFIMPCCVFANQDSIFVDTLFLKASQETNSTWATTITSGTLNGVRTTDIDATNLAFNSDLGFCIGFYYTADNTLDTKIYYSYFNTSASSHERIASQIIVPEFFSGFLSGNFFFGANIDWKILYSTIDWDLGTTIVILDKFTVRPAIGIKGASIKQKINSSWDAGIYTATENVKNNFYGIGPSLNINTNWKFYSGKYTSWDLIGDFSLALLWGKWIVNDIYSRPNVSGLITAANITTNFHNMELGATMLGSFLGLQWKYEDKYRFVFKLGYQMQWWVNQLRIPTFQQLPTHGDLTLQGAICGISVQL